MSATRIFFGWAISICLVVFANATSVTAQTDARQLKQTEQNPANHNCFNCATCERARRLRAGKAVPPMSFPEIKRRSKRPAEASARSGMGTQIVFLDFDSGVDGTINYTQARRDSIQAEMESHYVTYDVAMTQTQPAQGPYTTLVFNEGPPFNGLAEQIDFRNLSFDDNGIINLGAESSFTEPQILALSAFIGSHELGHLMGLQHRDAFGPLGTGVYQGQAGAFNPTYTGPQDAVETVDHIEGGGSFTTEFYTPKWFGERAAVKIAYGEQGLVIDEQNTPHGSIGTAQAIDLENMVVGNTLFEGQRFGLGDFSVDSAVVLGQISQTGEADYYRFSGKAGDIINFESIAAVFVFSNVPRYPNLLESGRIEVFQADGTPVDYYGRPADDFTGFDAIIFDLILPADGDYFVKISSSPNSNDTGNYELLVYRFNGTLAAPSAFDAFRGSFVSGDVSSIGDSDDADLCYNPGFTVSSTEAPVWLIFDGTIPGTTPDKLSMTVESSANTPGLTYTVELFDWTNNAYVEIGSTDEAFGGDLAATYDVTNGIGNYIDGSNAIRMRVGWRKTGFTIVFPWEVCIDRITWTFD